MIKTAGCCRRLTCRACFVVVASAAAVVAVRVALVEISDCRRTPSATAVAVLAAFERNVNQLDSTARKEQKLCARWRRC